MLLITMNWTTQWFGVAIGNLHVWTMGTLILFVQRAVCICIHTCIQLHRHTCIYKLIKEASILHVYSWYVCIYIYTYVYVYIYIYILHYIIIHVYPMGGWSNEQKHKTWASMDISMKQNHYVKILWLLMKKPTFSQNRRATALSCIIGWFQPFPHLWI